MRHIMLCISLLFVLGCSPFSPNKVPPPNTNNTITNVDQRLYKSSFKIYDEVVSSDIYSALLIIIDELDKRGVYKKQDMINALNTKNINILFTNGEKHKKKNTRCIYVESAHLKGKCLSGYFDGNTEIVLLKSANLHSSSLAHEVFHFFQSNLGGGKARKHHPRRLWKRLFGYKASGIGAVNQALKEAGL